MSQFFKALEQAERDRQREEEAAAQSAAPVSQTAPSGNGRASGEPVAPTAPAPEPVADRRPAAQPVAAAPSGPVSVASEPVVRQPIAAPVTREAAGTPPAPVATKPAERRAAAGPPPSPVPPAAPPVPPSRVPPAAPPVPPSPVVAAAPPVSPSPVVAAAPPVSPPYVPPAAPTPAAAMLDAPSPASVFRPALGKARRPGLLRRAAAKQPLLIAQTDPNSIEADAYRTLRAKIELMSDNGAFRYIAITSASGGDGKSTTAANLAVVAAQSGRRVCLIDADLRRPTLHDMFGLRNVEGLSVALEHGKPLSAVAKPVEIPNLSVVVAGRGGHETFRDVVTPQRLETILRDSQTAFDLIIFDTPPVTAVADAVNVAAVCDGVILVVRPGSIPLSALRRAVEQVRQVKGRMLGVLLNRVDPRAVDGESYGYGHAYYTKQPKS